VDFEKIRANLADWGEPAYRFRQVYEGATRGLASDFSELTTLPVGLRARLGQRPLRSLGIFPLAGGRGRIRRQVCEFIPGTLQCSERLLHNELRKGVEKFMAARTLLWRKGG